MARRLIPMVEIDEVLFRYQQGHTVSAIARALGQSRVTVRKYLKAGVSAGLTRSGGEGERTRVAAAVRAALARRPAVARVEPLAAHRAQLEAWLGEPDMTLKQAWRLLGEGGVRVSYSALKRYVRGALRAVAPRVTVRIETPPGRQAQVDFGLAPVAFVDGRRRRLWAFLMTLSYSRHRFVRFVEHQDVATWLDCHVRAFEFFGGVPETVLLDNLKAGVVRTDLYDPTLNRAYAELERHYGFTVDPARVRSPKDKGKVERGVPVVRQQVVAGRIYRDLAELNERALAWCRNDVGQVAHGTTQELPLVRFEHVERAALRPLPATPFDPPVWAECKVHPDHHLVFQRSYYSVPTRYVGKTVWVRATRRLVEVYLEATLIKTHPRASCRGSWQTDPTDYPEAAKAFLFAHPSHCRERARELGPHVERLVGEILATHALRHLRKAQAVLRLADKYGAERVEGACAHLLAFESSDVRRLTRILEQGLIDSSVPAATTPLAPSAGALEFLHPPESFSAMAGVEVGR
jgi:transposase